MPTIIKETGAVVTNANSYASRADGNAYADTALNVSEWQVASDFDKDRALIMATRAIDQMFQWNGYKANPVQSLQWPRQQCPDPDITDSASGLSFLPSGGYLDETKVPKAIFDATCHLATDLLKENRFEDKGGGGAGLKSLEIFQGIALEFDGSVKPDVVSDYLRMALSKYGQSVESGSVVKLQRA